MEANLILGLIRSIIPNMGKDQGGKIPKAEFDKMLKKKVISMPWNTFRTNIDQSEQQDSGRQNGEDQKRDKKTKP